jgi:hypothetical protein
VGVEVRLTDVYRNNSSGSLYVIIDIDRDFVELMNAGGAKVRMSRADFKDLYTADTNLRNLFDTRSPAGGLDRVIHDRDYE